MATCSSACVVVGGLLADFKRSFCHFVKNARDIVWKFPSPIIIVIIITRI